MDFPLKVGSPAGAGCFGFRWRAGPAAAASPARPSQAGCSLRSSTHGSFTLSLKGNTDAFFVGIINAELAKTEVLRCSFFLKFRFSEIADLRASLLGMTLTVLHGKYLPLSD